MEPQGAAYGFTSCVRKEVLTHNEANRESRHRLRPALRIEQGRVMVLLSGTYAPAAFSADWDNDETILSVIHELNFGQCAPKSQ